MTYSLKERRVSLGDCQSTFVLERMPTQEVAALAPVIVLLHGFGDSSYVWRDVMRDAGPRYRLLAPDLRGHGQSTWDAYHAYSLDEIVMDVKALILGLRLNDIALVGHSLGGIVAKRLCQSGELSVRKLMLVDVEEHPSESIVDAIDRTYASASAPFRTVAAAREWFQSTRPLATDSCVEAFVNYAGRTLHDGSYLRYGDPLMRLRYIIDRTAVEDGHLDHLERTMIIRGALSAVCTAPCAEGLAARYGADLRVIKGASHNVMLDRPVDFLRELELFSLPQDDADRSQCFRHLRPVPGITS